MSAGGEGGPSAPLTIRVLLAAARARLAGEDARADAEYLLCLVLDCSRAHLFAHDDAPVTAADGARFDALVARRAAGEPLAYLSGRREFWSLDLEVSPATLVPRPETECLVECALELVTLARAAVLDLGTGSGAIALALAAERPGWQVLGVDIEPAAVAIARSNATRLGLANAKFATGDWYAGLGQRKFELIVSNPPYIEASDPCLDGPGLRFEPRGALAAGIDGLAALCRVIEGARARLNPGGVLLCEHGYQQGAAVRALLGNAGFASIHTRRDLAGLERLSGGKLESAIAPELP